jgi:hypothetical protein
MVYECTKIGCITSVGIGVGMDIIVVVVVVGIVVVRSWSCWTRK